MDFFVVLKEGVVIVDSPGIGENGKKSGELQRYLAHSFGAIYLVNTASAGGVNSGRVWYSFSFLIHKLKMKKKIAIK